MPPRPFWPPLLAGFILGLVLLLTFLMTGHGLGASGFFTRFTAALGGWLAPAATGANTYLGPYLQSNPIASWISWEIVGVAIGALAGSITSGRFRLALERGPSIGANERLIYALIGGVLVGFGARLARGCTSGLGLSGGATLAVAAFVFLIAFFAAGFLVTFAARRVWR
ncbi:MAG: YeeE/YedE family protein [Alphaproteobacteria bacterium]|nr:YeeE/YedE family protein [Alphaproteobacteria bacterium]